MGWDGGGNITLLYDWGTDRDAGAPDHFIQADRFDAYGADLAAAIEATLNRNGENAIAANISWGGYKLTSLGNPTAATDAVNARKVADNALSYGGTTGGSSNAYTCTHTYLAAVATGTRLLLLANHTNDGAATLNVNGAGAVAIVQRDGTTALSGGEIVSGDFFEVAYDGTSFVLISALDLSQVNDLSITGTLTVTGAMTATGAITGASLNASSNSKGLIVTNTADSAGVGIATFQGDRATVASNDTAYVDFMLSNDVGQQTVAARYHWIMPTVTDGAEVGAMYWSVMSGGSLQTTLRINAASFTPTVNDQIALGSSSLSFSDLFLASGAVVNWNNGDVTATHATNTLTFAGATTGYVFSDGVISSGAGVVPSSNDGAALGTTSLKFSDLFLASGAVINFNSGDVTATHAANSLTLAGATTGYFFQDGPVACNSNFVPTANDGAGLGTTSLKFSDLFLASGAVINFNSGDVTATHALNTLTFAGATTGYVFSDGVISSGAGVVPSSSDGAALGSASLQWSDAFLATGGVINWANGACTLTYSAAVNEALTMAGYAFAIAADHAITAATETTYPFQITDSNGSTIGLTAGTDDSHSYVQTFNSHRLYLNNLGNPVYVQATSGLFFPNLTGTTGGSAVKYNTGTDAIFYDTSSQRYKTDIEDMEPARANAILSARPVFYRSTQPGDDPRLSWYGLIAEELAVIEPRLVGWRHKDEDCDIEYGLDGVVVKRTPRPGTQPVPDSVHYDRLTVMLLKIVQQQEARIAALEAANA